MLVGAITFIRGTLQSGSGFIELNATRYPRMLISLAERPALASLRMKLAYFTAARKALTVLSWSSRSCPPMILLSKDAKVFRSLLLEIKFFDYFLEDSYTIGNIEWKTAKLIQFTFGFESSKFHIFWIQRDSVVGTL